MRSALSAKVFAFIEVFDAAYMTAVELEYTHEKRFDLFMFTYSLQLFDALARENSKECRLMINISAARQSYKR